MLAFNFLVLSRDFRDSPVIFRGFVGIQSGVNVIVKKRNFYSLSVPNRLINDSGKNMGEYVFLFYVHIRM